MPLTRASLCKRNKAKDARKALMSLHGFPTLRYIPRREATESLNPLKTQCVRGCVTTITLKQQLFALLYNRATVCIHEHYDVVFNFFEGQNLEGVNSNTIDLAHLRSTYWFSEPMKCFITASDFTSGDVASAPETRSGMSRYAIMDVHVNYTMTVSHAYMVILDYLTMRMEFYNTGGDPILDGHTYKSLCDLFNIMRKPFTGYFRSMICFLPLQRLWVDEPYGSQEKWLYPGTVQGSCQTWVYLFPILKVAMGMGIQVIRIALGSLWFARNRELLEMAREYLATYDKQSSPHPVTYFGSFILKHMGPRLYIAPYDQYESEASIKNPRKAFGNRMLENYRGGGIPQEVWCKWVPLFQQWDLPTNERRVFTRALLASKLFR